MTRYELLERIGAGGMAEIFRGKAVAAGGFEKPVAIKRILPHLSQDKRFVDLLITEAKTLASLRHRNIVQIFDVGLGDDGQYFLVMEFVDGADVGALQQRLESHGKRMPLELTLYTLGAVCEALEHAHATLGDDDKPIGLVHRDVSPSNVLVSRNGEVKLTDFGIAKLPEEATGHGGVRGKFAYISPEQAANQHVDARSDVFSVGILLYELVTGRRLFSGMPDFDALRAVREHRVANPRAVDPKIDPKVEALIIKALAARPEDRFATAGELGTELRNVRYSMPETESDPATDLARIVSTEAPPRVAKGKRSQRVTADFPEAHEPTVVRIKTVVGFTQTGLTGSVADPEDQELRDSVTKLTRATSEDDVSDDEETRTLDLDVLRAKRAASEAEPLGENQQRPNTDNRSTRPLAAAAVPSQSAAAAAVLSSLPSIPDAPMSASLSSANQSAQPEVIQGGPHAAALRASAPPSRLPGLAAANRDTSPPAVVSAAAQAGPVPLGFGDTGGAATATEPNANASRSGGTRAGLRLAFAAIAVCVVSFVLARFLIGTAPPPTIRSAVPPDAGVADALTETPVDAGVDAADAAVPKKKPATKKSSTKKSSTKKSSTKKPGTKTPTTKKSTK